MKIIDLRNWYISNGIDDKWYIFVAGKSDPTIYNLEAVEKIAKEFMPADVHVVHVTQTPINGQSGWVKLEEEIASHTRERNSVHDHHASETPSAFSAKDWFCHIALGSLLTCFFYFIVSDHTIAYGFWFFILLWAWFTGFDQASKWFSRVFFHRQTHRYTKTIVGIFGLIIWTLLFINGCEAQRESGKKEVYRLLGH